MRVKPASRTKGNAAAVPLLDYCRAVATWIALAACVWPQENLAGELFLQRVASGLDAPLYATAPIADTERLFIVEKVTGRIKILRLDTLALETQPFLTVTGLSTSGERGLLGLAFHPLYASNGLLFVFVTNSDGDSEIRRYRVSADPDRASPASERLVIRYDQTFSNHNGGWLGFGPDGYLYVASGDGGSGNDPNNEAQSLHRSLLGKILRLDVNADDFPADASRNYAIPPDNPFAVSIDRRPARPEIWAYGLRNPWRASFDRANGDLYIGDVGQNTREEINYQPASSAGGENYGWRLREGRISTPTGGVGGAKPSGNVDPIYDYEHGAGAFKGNSVTGGYVYRGPVLPARGKYFFGDFVFGRIWSFEPVSGRATKIEDWTDRLQASAGTVDQVASFAEDSRGHLYLVDFDGELFRLAGPTLASLLPAIQIIVE
ncbi:MAG: PQQ-dependent sugar dehydrogenase [Gammaproteobacteria bacterium]